MFAIAAEAEAMLASAQRQCLREKWETRVSHFPFIWWTRPGWVRVPVSARISTCRPFRTNPSEMGNSEHEKNLVWTLKIILQFFVVYEAPTCRFCERIRVGQGHIVNTAGHVSDTSFFLTFYYYVARDHADPSFAVRSLLPYQTLCDPLFLLPKIQISDFWFDLWVWFQISYPSPFRVLICRRASFVCSFDHLGI
ncbi:hypothetical protein B296_00026668 [Ensete ventricosum]|uniref:Uncharacterized protein n=1 Tax=Ensete ventricosum TaxID=4639 RepID=A0A427ARA5_ENSVE|nr:hypothetical protein B296_00026668 [Ensete ventricosum]